jgi:hypothetical protein
MLGSDVSVRRLDGVAQCVIKRQSGLLQARRSRGWLAVPKLNGSGKPAL